MKHSQFLLNCLAESASYMMSLSAICMRNYERSIANHEPFNLKDTGISSALGCLKAVIVMLNESYDFGFMIDPHAMALKEEKVNRFAKYSDRCGQDVHRLQLLADKINEEAAEVVVRCIKAKHYGLLEVQPEQPYNNIQRLHGELIDLYAVIKMMSVEFGDNQFKVDQATAVEQTRIIKKEIIDKSKLGILHRDEAAELALRNRVTEWWKQHKEEIRLQEIRDAEFFDFLDVVSQ